MTEVETDAARVVAAVRRANKRNQVRKQLNIGGLPMGPPPAVAQFEQEMNGYRTNAALPRDPMEFLAGTFTPLTPIQPVGINIPVTDDDDRPAPRQREMPPGWNMPVGVPGSEGFKLASFSTLRTYADVYSVARACVQVRKGEIRGLEWDIMPTEEAEKRMRGDRKAHRDFAERKKIVVSFFKKPDPDYFRFGSYIDAIMEEMLVTDALSLYLHPTRKKGKGPFGKGLAALEIISGSTIRPLVNTRGGRVSPPNPGYQQYLYGVPRVDLMELLMGSDQEQIQELGKPVQEYRGDQLMYLPYTQRSWTPYGFPPLERTLIPTITGLRKQQYQLDYFDEGTIPGNFISPGEQLGWTPNQLQIWQDQQNAIAGDPAYKHKSLALPPGSKVFPMRPVPLADQFDEIIMTQVCMGYDVMPMEMGISPKVSTTQSSGAANQMAKASQDTNERKSLKPTLAFLTDIFNVIIQDVWLQEDMRFLFEGLEEDQDENSLVERLVQMLSFGMASIDECRIALDKPPWGLPMTSDPVFVSATSGMVPIGSIDPTTGKPMGAPPPAPLGAPPAPGGPPGLPPGQSGGPPGQVGVGGAPKPAAIPGSSAAAPGGKTPAGVAGKPSGPAANAQGTPAPGAGPGGAPTDQKPSNPRDNIAPDDKVGQARADAQEAHAGLQADLHQQFAQGKPLEPPVRPPINAETESADRPAPPQKNSKGMLSELAALTRHLNKGRDIETWEVRNLPDQVLDYHKALVKSFEPDDAAAITHEFIIACFGPPTLTAQIEDVRAGVKTFSTAAPLDATDGKQGLAPYDLAGQETPIRKQCPDCGQPMANHPPGRCDNGATSDGGATKAAMSGPKVPPTRGRPTRDWPGWKYDQELARIYASELDEQLAAAVDPGQLAREWLEAQSIAVKGVLGNLAQQAWSWLSAMGYVQKVQDAIGQVLNNLWAEGFAVGKESGKEALDSAYDSSFWDSWHPGDARAAALTAGPGLQAMLQGYGIQTIKSVAQTRMHDLADVLADGFQQGQSSDWIADQIKPILVNKQRADMIATTELARATTLASVGEYRAAHQEGKRWSVTPDERLCPICKANKAAGVIPIDQAFPGTGSTFAPAHPNCRCAILPDDLTDSAIPDLDNLTGVQKGLLGEYLDSGLTMVDWAIDSGYDPETALRRWITKGGDDPVSTDGYVAGGLAVRADDTGRVLMIQRAYDEDDPAGGFWEFPGGRPEPGEDAEDAARREWAEETGLAVPAGSVVATWDAGDYRGHVLPVESEDAVPILDRAKGANPDDPDNTEPEALAWWDPAELKDNPAIRPELQDHPKRVRKALEASGLPVGKSAPGAVLECLPVSSVTRKSTLSDLATSLDQQYVDEHNELSDRVSAVLRPPTGQVVYDQLLKNYPPESIEWVKRAKWRGPYLIPWDKIDHDDMDKWAASHQPGKVDHFADKIEAGDDPDPAVCVADPDGNYIDVDGHHRALAYHKLNRPVRAWIGAIDPADRHAMEETHLDQVHEGSDPLNKSVGGAVYKDAIHGHHVAGTPFTYHHGYIPINPGDCGDGCGGKTKGGKYLPGHDAKHVKQLHEAVTSGAISHEEAHGMLAASPKLQDKLATKLGKPAPAKAAHPAPGEMGPGNAEGIAGEDPTDEEVFSGASASDTAKNTYKYGTAPGDRNFTTITTPTGIGSTYEIAARPDGTGLQRDLHTKFTYLGGGKVQIERFKPELATSTKEETTMDTLKGGTPFYKAAHDQLLDAHVLSAIVGKPKPKKPKAPAVQPGDHYAPWKTGNASKLKEGLTGSAPMFKAKVASRIADRIDATASEMVAALYPPGFNGGTNVDKLKDAAAHPENYTYTKESYGGNVNVFKKGETNQITGQPIVGQNGDLTDKVLKEFAASSLIQTWASTSNDSNVRSLAIQHAAVEEFGLDNVAPWATQTDELHDNVMQADLDHGATYRKFLRAQYDNTQEDFAELGIKDVNVTRGMGWGHDSVPDWAKGLSEGDKIDAPPLRPLSSWTVNAATANSFNNGVYNVKLRTTVPASAVLSWPNSGFGCLSEYELVVLAGKGTVTVGANNLPGPNY